jgi:uncharacterized protein YkwD
VLSKAPDVYGGPVTVSWGTPEDNQAVANAFESGIKTELKPGWIHDPALDLAAAALLYTYSKEEEQPSETLQQWTLWRAGVPRTLNNQCFSFSTGRGRQNVPSFFDDWARDCAASVSYRHASYGVARIRLGANSWYQVALVAGAVGVLEPVPMSPAPGAPVLFRIALSEGYSNPILYIDDPVAGVVRKYLKKEQDGKHYQVTLNMPTTPGRYQFEINANDPKSDPLQPESLSASSVAWGPLFVGVPIDATPDKGLIPSETTPVNNPAEYILSGYNAERAKFGLSPMTLSPEISALAQERAVSAVKDKKTTPLEKDFDKKLASMGIETQDVSWNSRGYEFLSDALPLYLRSPVRRDRVLWKGSVQLGVGVERVQAKKTKDSYESSYDSFRQYEILAKLVPTFSADKERQELMDGLNELRTEAGDPALTVSGDLTKVAQKLAESVCSGQVDPPRSNAFVDAIQREVPNLSKFTSYGAWGGAIARASLRNANDIAKKKQLYPQIGIGVCQGKFKGRTTYLYALMIFADP